MNDRVKFIEMFASTNSFICVGACVLCARVLCCDISASAMLTDKLCKTDNVVILRGMGISSKSSVIVDRPIYQQDDLNIATHYEKPGRRKIKNVLSSIKSVKCGSFLKDLFPILQWLPEYNIKMNLMGDIIAGTTVAVMHIPQGMAYGLLGHLDPIVGIYMAFFPVLMYTIFGTSRHVSIGTFAIMSLMTGKVVTQLSTDDTVLSNSTVSTNSSVNVESTYKYTNYEVATAVTFTVSLFHLLMYICRLGILSTFLSATLVNGFTTGAAAHVVFSQLKDLLGLKIPRRTGFFRNGYILMDIFMEISTCNYAAIIISVVAIVVMVINNEILKPIISKKTKIPVPIELIVVSLATLLSYLFDFSGNYDVNIVGFVPTGLPPAVAPTFSLIKSVAIDSFIIAIVSYAITVSMCLIFAQKLSYEVNPNQELLALGASNMFGSFFSCMPISASLSRSLLQQSTGGVTQVASLVSCSLLLIILLWVGPVFKFLPRCILASIIVVALKGMFVQAKELVRYWKLNKLDALVWLVTFCSVVFIDIGEGLAAGLVISLFVIFIQSFKPYVCLMGLVPNTDLYLDTRRYKGAEEIEHIKIFHYCGGINFASRSLFKSCLNKKVGFDAKKIIIERKKKGAHSPVPDENEQLLIKFLIVDLSAVSYIDPAGVEQLRVIASDYNQLGIGMFLAGAFGPIYETLIACDIYDKKEGLYSIFPTIHDAVLYARQTMKRDSNPKIT